MQGRPTTQQLASMRGRPVYGSGGEQVGSIKEIYYDETSGDPEWIGLDMGFLGMKRVVVPVQGAQIRDGDNVTVHVPYTKDKVKDSPEVPEDEISSGTESDLYAYYGLRGQPPQPEPRERAGQPEGTMTRSEEELRVGKRPVERGRVRLRKWVETEPAQEDVTLRHEEARVTREPVEGRTPGAEIGEEEMETTLHEEEPVVGKETVAKERYGLEKEEEITEETVSEELRKERVDIEREGETGEERPR